MWSPRRSTEFEARQALRARIARQRLHCDRRVDDMANCALLIAAPRRFLSQHPGRSLLTAAGFGILFSRLFSRDGWLAGLPTDGFDEHKWRAVWRDFQAIFRSEPIADVSAEADDE